MMAAQAAHVPVPLPHGANPGAASFSPNSVSPSQGRSISIPVGATDHSARPRLLTPFDQGDIKILLLENISQGAVALLRNQGYQVDHVTKAWSEEELIEKIGEYHVIGIRSKTRLTARVFRKAAKVGNDVM